MNFLAHSLISLEIDTKTNQQTLYGNFAGDFYKGLIQNLDLADDLKGGVILHRLIDNICDRQDSFTTELLRNNFGRYKGIVSDIMIDHFLAKNFQALFSKDLNAIQRGIFQQINQYRAIFPENFIPMFNWLESRNALSSYADLDFLEKVFLGMSSRVKKGEILRNAVTEIWQNYTLLEEAAIQEFFYCKRQGYSRT
ncbi:acyl carrier protein phosphodiesterase [Mannheimia haemolytica]|nr:acyl carrier protein phosphodiesterase [Mannheimia haemolytica]